MGVQKWLDGMDSAPETGLTNLYGNRYTHADRQQRAHLASARSKCVCADVDAAVRCPTAVQIQALGSSQDMGTPLLADGGVTLDASSSTQAPSVYCAI